MGRTITGRLARQIGRRGAFLLYLALLDLIYAVSLLFPTERARTNPTMVFLSEVLPLPVWAALWGGVGLVCLFYAFRKRDAAGYAAAMLIKVFWALTFLLGWLFADVERGYLSAVIWGAFVAVVAIISGWRENPEIGEDDD